VQQGGFAAATRAHYGDELAFLDLDVDVIEGNNGGIASAVDYRKVFRLNERHG
jgi:hypothetical protein